jgi:hypothetical protein
MKGHGDDDSEASLSTRHHRSTDKVDGVWIGFGVDKWPVLTAKVNDAMQHCDLQAPEQRAVMQWTCHRGEMQLHPMRRTDNELCRWIRYPGAERQA